jgi:hypothetical protein
MCWVGLVGSSQCGVGWDFGLECGVRLDHRHWHQQGLSKIKIKVFVFKHFKLFSETNKKINMTFMNFSAQVSVILKYDLDEGLHSTPSM